MGSVLSAIGSLPSQFSGLIGPVRDVYSAFSGLRARNLAGPGSVVPPPNSTRPFWLTNPPFPELANMQSPCALPTEADVVVIGSGITAAAAVWGMLGGSRRTGGPEGEGEGGASFRKLDVVVLEAREVCSGATGRNGGHIKATPFGSFGTLRNAVGESAAARVVRFQLMHLGCLVELCEREGWDAAECREVHTVDYFTDEEAFVKAKRGVGDIRHHVPEFEMHIHEAAEAREKYDASNHVVGAISYKAGALWPYRLVTSAWHTLLAAHDTLSIQTRTPVESIIAGSGATPFPFTVVTPRGRIKAAHVLHATNAWAPALVPGLRGYITGAKGHMTARRPMFPETNAPLAAAGGEKPGDRSWSVFYKGGFDYVTQRPVVAGEADSGGGEVILGGGFFRSHANGLDMLGVWDDTTTDDLTLAHNLGIPAVVSERWRHCKDEVSHEWSGVLAVTGDTMPLVGRLDGKLTGRKLTGRRKPSDKDHGPAEWISAGYSGEGMVNAWLCGVAVGAMIGGTAAEDIQAHPGRPQGKVRDWLPDSLVLTKARLRRANLGRLSSFLE